MVKGKILLNCQKPDAAHKSVGIQGDYANVLEALHGLDNYFRFYNTQRMIGLWAIGHQNRYFSDRRTSGDGS